LYDEEPGAFRWRGWRAALSGAGLSGNASGSALFGNASGSALFNNASASSQAPGQPSWAEDEDAIVLPAPLVYGLGFWWGFHLVVMITWGGFFCRRCFYDPRKRNCMGKRWGKDGVDWYEPIAFDCH
jgi:hypothetical protein